MFSDKDDWVDLGDYPLGYREPTDDYSRYEPDYSSAPYIRQPLYTFYSEEDLVTSAIFQKHLSMALAHKDKNIRELQNEILNYMEMK